MYISSVTRTLNTAKFDLTFFFLLFSLVHTLYAFLGCLLFGNQTGAYSDLGQGWLAGLQMIMGAYDPEDDVGQDAWTTCFYWSYMVIAFFLLLNALLAIIVEAYDTVKQSTNEDKIDVLFIFAYENKFVNQYRAGPCQLFCVSRAVLLYRVVRFVLYRRVSKYRLTLWPNMPAAHITCDDRDQTTISSR